ncbi:FAD-dependent oxidoreductase [Halomonas sp. DP1Y21-3]|uniref:FAD/NAD(P)-dependent oxidoreductase n=1 Tax=Halomonas sp. DP1Y21-3 TaxID=2859080 RepID=UPI001C94FBD3|nr:NAD(P)/FAD-dependent oxidoreductase [Halomonas sp. DP1Y21-3]MBY6112478.1 FAD-dependent oxidoreductase [Halomonas sp. DP1Y21-3]
MQTCEPRETVGTDGSKDRARVVVLGAGPAGMAAALRLAEAGLRSLVLDQARAPGGQIYRDLDQPQLDAAVMGKDYHRGRALVGAFLDAARRGEIDYRPGTRVWWIEALGDALNDALDDGLNDAHRLGVRGHDGISRELVAERLIIATGAMERGWPFPGWQLPGVMQAGAAQILMKQGALLTEGPPVLAGNGPLLYLLAWQYLNAGCPPRMILDTAPNLGLARTLRHPLRAWRARGYLAKGARMLAALRRAGVPIVRGVQSLAAEGDQRLTGVRYRRRGDSDEHRLKTDWLLTHMGVVPEPQLPRGLGIEHRWQEAQQAFVPNRRDDLSVRPGVWLAGDGGGIGGAVNAEREGRLAALAVLDDLMDKPLDDLMAAPLETPADAKGAAAPIPDADNRRAIARESARAIAKESAALRRRRRQDLSGRRLLDALFTPPADWVERQPGETLICRCEGVSQAQLKAALEAGPAGPNQLKAFTRCGMGPCQGRLCGTNVSRLMAREQGRDMDEVGYYRIRPPLTSITLGELALAPSDHLTTQSQ